MRETSHIPGKRIEQLVDSALANRQISKQSDSPTLAWEDPERAKLYLENLAWEMHTGAGHLAMQEAVRLLTSSTRLSKGQASLFLQRMEEQAGLLDSHISPPHRNDEEQRLLAFASQQPFQDYFAGRYLWRQWQQKRKKTEQDIQEWARMPDWQPVILTCLGLMGKDAVWPLILHALAENPLWGARCLQEGLGLRYADLARREREQIYRQLSDCAYRLLYPGQRRKVSGWRRLFSKLPPEADWNTQLEALQTLGVLQVGEAGPVILKAALSPRYDNRMRYLVREPLIRLGPQSLWPEIQPVLKSEDLWLPKWARDIVIEWKGPVALELFRKLLRQPDYQRMALEGIACLGLPEAETSFMQALDDPLLASTAFDIALEQHRPEAIAPAVDKVQSGKYFSYIQFHDLLGCLSKIPLEDAAATMEKLLLTDTVSSKMRDFFEVGRDLQLPTLRILVCLLRHPNPAVVEAVSEKAIPRVLKSGEPDPLWADVQQVLEQLLLYGNERNQYAAAEILRSTTLSDQACQTLIEQLDFSTSDWWQGVMPLGTLSPISENCRQQLILALKPGLKNREAHALT